MALAGDGFLAMWHDIASEAEEEYNLWHTQEHMPERVGIPGFKVARRYVDWNLKLHRYFTLYEGQAIETFDSPDYIARLNAPTSWTQKMMPAFRNMVRGACRTVATAGTGIGGALATLRFSPTDGTATSMPEVAQGLVGHVLTLRGVIAVHIGVVDHKVTGVPTNEREMRQATNEDAFDAVLLVEGLGRRELEAVLSDIEARLGTYTTHDTPINTGVYDIAFLLVEDAP